MPGTSGLIFAATGPNLLKMDELSGTDIEALRRLLLARRAELAAADAATEGWRDPVELDQQSVGRLSRMDAIQQQAMAEAEARRRKTEMGRIDTALKRLDEGEYGWCQTCGEAVARKRLEIDPAATHCVGCAV